MNHDQAYHRILVVLEMGVFLGLLGLVIVTPIIFQVDLILALVIELSMIASTAFVIYHLYAALWDRHEELAFGKKYNTHTGGGV